MLSYIGLCTDLSVSFSIGQVVGSGVVVVTVAWVSPFFDEQFHDGDVTGRGSFMKRTAMVLSLCIHQCSSAPNICKYMHMYERK